ncbi:uncharacterized protein LOC119668163 [Teleopsis dalmanni]|uniref:uncharacterized protein LOC119668163 n=1 Tax=Teleopsis dalmanni TaxID=139649 RepID=UPI0018CF1CCD|nr:uncharacterized protein LOC119668163 [Teleopsis dalmanni]
MEYLKPKILSATIEVIGKQYNLEPNNICHIGSQRPELPNDILIEDQSIKNTHAAVTNFDGNWYIISRTGKDTYVNGIETTRCPVKLKDQDKIKFGDIEAQFNLNKTTEVTNVSSGYEDIISSSPELLSRRHLIFKSNEREKNCDNVIDTTCDDSFVINATQNNLEISKENDEMCFIPETQALPTYIDKSNLEGGFGEIMDSDESQFCINSEAFKDVGDNVDINNSVNDALTSLVIPYIHHDTVMLFDEKRADDNVLNSAEQSLSNISKNCVGKKSETDTSDKLNLSTTNKIGELETNNIDEREGSCTPDLFDEIITYQINREKESQKSPCSKNEESNANSLSHHSPPVDDNNLLPTQKFKQNTLDENGLISNISQKENKEPKKPITDFSGLEATQIFTEPDLETPQFFKSKYIKPKELPQIEILNKTEVVNNNSNDINHDEWLDQVTRPRISTDFIELLKSSKANTSKNKKVSNSPATTEKKLRVNMKEIDTKEKSLSKSLKSIYGNNSTDSETSAYSNDDKNELRKYLKRNSDDSLKSGGKKRRISNSSQDKNKSSSEQSDASNQLNKKEKILNCKVNLKKSILSIEVSAIESKLGKKSKGLDTSKLKHKDHKKIRSTSEEETKHSTPPKPQLAKKDEKNSATKNSKSHDLKKKKVSTDKNASKSNEKEILNTSKDDKTVTHSNTTKRTTTEKTEGQVIEKKSRRSAKDPKSVEKKQKSMNTSTPLVEKRRNTRLASETEAQIPNATTLKKVDKESPGKHAVKKKITKPATQEPATTDKRNTRHNVSKNKSPPKAEASNSKEEAAKAIKAQPTKKLVSEEHALPRRTTRLMSFKRTEDKEDVKKNSNKSEHDASASKDKEVSKEQKKEKPPILVSFSTIDLSDILYLKHQSNNLWDEADHAKNCDVLIMNKASRTIKFLIAIARGIPIVTLDWLSKKSANSNDLSNCMLEDKEFERKYNFKLLNALAKSHKAKLFKGYEFSMTENISPGNKDMQDLLSCTGAIVHTTVSSNAKNSKSKKNIKAMYLISSEKDKNIWEHCSKYNSKLHVVSTEGVMLAVMHQDVIYLDIHSLK